MDVPVPPKPAKRVCLKCQQLFKSRSAGHRVCGKCRLEYNKIAQRNIHLPVIHTPEKDK